MQTLYYWTFIFMLLLWPLKPLWFLIFVCDLSFLSGSLQDLYFVSSVLKFLWCTFVWVYSHLLCQICVRPFESLKLLFLSDRQLLNCSTDDFFHFLRSFWKPHYLDIGTLVLILYIFFLFPPSLYIFIILSGKFPLYYSLQ